MREYINAIRELMKPKYHELTPYLFALVCLELLIILPGFRQMLSAILLPMDIGEGGEAGVALIGLIFIGIVGFFLSILHAFIFRKKSITEKLCMGVFLLGINGFAGIVAGAEMLPAEWSILAIFPLWNILTGAVSLSRIGLGFDISDENVSLLEVIGASIVLSIMVAIIEYGFNLSWASVLSISLFNASVVSFLTIWISYYYRSNRLNRAH